MQELDADSLFHLRVLELNSGVAIVAVGVIMGEHAERLIVSVLGQKPTWGPKSHNLAH